MSPYFAYQRESDALTISLKDDWTFGNAKELDDALRNVQGNGAQQITFQCGGLQNIDLTGAWVLFRKSQEFEAEGRDTQFLGFRAAHFKFLQNITDIRDSAVAAQSAEPAVLSKAGRLRQILEIVGRTAAAAIEDVGRIAHAVLGGITHPSRLALDETIRQIEETGVKAAPLVMLIAFFMGIILAYQGANQLAEFGAEILVADLVTVSMLREMGVLLAGIMVAGRSGSAFAASIGVMKLNEEIDALRVMGLNPNHVLIAPRIVALVISLPLLAVLGMMAGMIGGLTLSALALDISTVQYIERTVAIANNQDFLVGLVKAPVFALLIAGVGTLRGIQVSGSAEQLGRLTTKAVVQAVVLVVFADAIFTIVFSRLGI